MLNTRTALLLCLSSIVCSAGPVTARFINRDLLISDRGREITLRRVVAPYAKRMVVHSVSKHGGLYFILAGGSQPSRPGVDPFRRCGMGEDHYIEWLVASSTRVRERQAAPYTACEGGNVGVVGGWRNGRFIWTKEGPDGTKTRYWFDISEPEEGIREAVTIAEQLESTTAEKLGAFEHLASESHSRVIWAKTLGRIEGVKTHAVINAIIFQDLAATRLMRGVQVDLKAEGAEDRVYVGEEFLRAFAETWSRLELKNSEAQSNGSKAVTCDGATPVRPAALNRARFLWLSLCQTSDGTPALQIFTGSSTFLFVGVVECARFGIALRKAGSELDRH